MVYSAFVRAFFAFLFLNILFANLVQAAIPAAERGALLALFNTNGGTQWHNNSNWDTSAASVGDECNWYGVTCDAGQTTVIGLQLQANNLKGRLPDALTNLTGLNSNDLRFNGVYSDNQLLIDFLDAAGPGGTLLETQTLDPENVRITAVSDISFDIAWDLASYAQVNAYRIYLATHSATAGAHLNLSDFELKIEVDATMTHASFENLSTCTQYFVKVQSVTGTHADNANSIESDGKRNNIIGTIPVSTACDVVGGQLKDSFTIDYEAVNPLLATIQLNATGERSYVLAGRFSWNLDGAAGENSLSLVSSGTNAWVLNGNNPSTVNNNSFTNMQNLIGGAGVDTFTINAGVQLNGTINGGGGTEDKIVVKGGEIEGGADACERAGGVIVSTGNILEGSNCEITVGGGNIAILDGDINLGNGATLTIPDNNNVGVLNPGIQEVKITGTGNITVAEDVQLNSLVTTLGVEPVLSQGITYAIVSGNVNDTFIIDGTTGEIRVNKRLDFETTEQYILEVKASLGNDASITGTVTINVTDVNDGAGCTLRRGAPFDPVLLLLLVLGYTYIRRCRTRS